MSRSDYGAAAPGDQDKKAKSGVTSRHARTVRLMLGSLTVTDLMVAFGVSHHTVKEWEQKGLKSFRPGTKDSMFLRSDVEEFLRRKESFRGKSKKSQKRSTNGKEHGPQAAP